MTDDDETVEFGTRATERLIFFSDAVVAIAMTLLALDLPVPDGRTVHDLLNSAHDHVSAYIAFLLSFVVIALHWRGHHRVFGYLARSDSRLMSLNLLWLMTMVLWIVGSVAGRMLTGRVRPPVS